MDKYVCRQCGKAFVPDAKSLRNPNYRAEFCSRVCANKGRSRPLRQRFAEYMAAAPVSATGCWLWPGALDRNGYGVITDENRRQLRAPRVSYELNTGPIPEGKQILHSCDVPACINPAHLSLGTSAENTADRDAKGRQQRGVKHHRARLTEADVQAIRAAHDSGETQTALGVQYGVSQRLISGIVRSDAGLELKSSHPRLR